ncbi:MAG: hypothetical protein HY661_10780 [Betaproteobacteria bacterium]|nr:hypothetical protein [Betaproteobacteria bacterium]
MPITSRYGRGGKDDHLLAHIGRALLLATVLVVLLLLPSPAWAPFAKWIDQLGAAVISSAAAISKSGTNGGKLTLIP